MAKKSRSGFEKMMNDFLKKSNEKSKEIKKRNETKLEGRKRDDKKGKGFK